jgi:predicted flap endonuclease-1-like 5' DNA nuclease
MDRGSRNEFQSHEFVRSLSWAKAGTRWLNMKSPAAAPKQIACKIRILVTFSAVNTVFVKGDEKMNYKIEEIEGIGKARAEKLAKAGIKTTGDLLAQAASARGRKVVAEKCEVSPVRLLKWVNMADLMRISGVGEEYSELLEAANCNTVKQLRRRNPANLTKRMLEINLEKKLVRSPPSEVQVKKWVEQAAKLEPMLTY